VKTFNDFSKVSEKINSIQGLTDMDKANLCNLMFDVFKEHLKLQNTNIELKAKLRKAHQEIWR
jgi:hypothetical protein